MTRACDGPDDAVHVVRDHLGKADAFLTAAESLLEQPAGIDGDDSDDLRSRRRNHVAHLIESAKLAVRAAAYAGEELAKLQGGA